MKERLKKQADKFVFWGILVLGCVDLLLQRYFRTKDIGVDNRGVSLGSFQGMGWELILVVWLLLVAFLWRNWHKGWAYRLPVWLMIVGGAVNLLERLLGGGVWDYLRFPLLGLWFNLSDVMIMSGLGFIVLRK